MQIYPFSHKQKNPAGQGYIFNFVEYSFVRFLYLSTLFTFRHYLSSLYPARTVPAVLWSTRTRSFALWDWRSCNNIRQYAYFLVSPENYCYQQEGLTHLDFPDVGHVKTSQTSRNDPDNCLCASENSG